MKGLTFFYFRGLSRSFKSHMVVSRFLRVKKIFKILVGVTDNNKKGTWAFIIKRIYSSGGLKSRKNSIKLL